MIAASRIFLAHAREDKAQARKLYSDLKARGFNPWLDEVDLVPGQIWKDEISKAIRQAGVFLACLSSRSVKKAGYVQNEFRLALAAFGERPPGSIYLIPVRLDECDAPDLQIPDRGLSLRDIHWVDLWEEGGFDRLAIAIEMALGPAVRLSDPSIPDRQQAAHIDAPHLDETLTPLESDVLVRLRQGKSNKNIAHELEISYGAVKNYVRRILIKLQAANRMEMALQSAPIEAASEPNLQETPSTYEKSVFFDPGEILVPDGEDGDPSLSVPELARISHRASCGLGPSRSWRCR